LFKIPNEFKVGVMATIAIVLLVLGYNLMRGKHILSSERIYYAKYDDVQGVAIAGHVRYNGVNVGRVQEINLTNGGRGQNVVVMNVSPDLDIPKGSVARIVQIDLFGTKAIQIELSSSKEMLASGDTLLSSVMKDAISEVTVKAANLLGSLDSLVNNVNSVFDSRTKASLQKSFVNIEGTLQNFDKTMATSSDRLDKILANIESITSNLNANKEAINQTLANLNSISDSLSRIRFAETINQAEEALAQVSEVMKKINEGSGTLGLLVNDQKLYNNLDSSSRSLDIILKELHDNPGKYVPFKKDKSKKN
jgi:phospholipid/cholesterol/gamma-HCH transport system substrate-binding protein